MSDRPSFFAELQRRNVQLFENLSTAIAGLEHLLLVPAGIVFIRLRLDPRRDPLRRDPRLRQLIAGEETPRAKPRPLAAPGRSGIVALRGRPADRPRAIPDGHHGQLTSMRPLA